MDTEKVGNFLKKLRLENKMTQEQLGEQIGMTNKTISRWETGKYMPPIESLKLLSDMYQISINEIIAGKRVSDNKYVKLADENISAALEELESKENKFEKGMRLMLCITNLLTIAIIWLLPKGNSREDIIRNVAIIVLLIAMMFISNVFNLVATVLNKVVISYK